MTFPGSMLAGALAGCIAKTITYPLDLSRKRMQLQGFQQARVGFGQVRFEFESPQKGVSVVCIYNGSISVDKFSNNIKIIF